MTKVITSKPPRWRQGQTIFNFLEWLVQKGYAGGNQNYRMADPFHIQDEEFEKFWEEFMREVGGIKND